MIVVTWIVFVALLVAGIASVVIRERQHHTPTLRADPAHATPASPSETYRYTAYLVATLDSKYDPPRVCYLRMFSSPAESLTRTDNTCQVTLAKGSADTWEEAEEQVHYQLRTFAWLAWAKTWFDENRGYLMEGTQQCEACGAVLAKDPLVQEARRARAVP